MKYILELQSKLLSKNRFVTNIKHPDGYSNQLLIQAAITEQRNLLEVSKKIELLMRWAEQDKLDNWADFGARVYLLADELRAAIPEGERL